MKTLTFTNKNQYITWRANWRQQYNALSSIISALKKERADKDSAVRAGAQSALHYRRLEACKLMELRAASKVRSQELWVAEHAHAVAA
jgi:hypothetical protein